MEKMKQNNQTIQDLKNQVMSKTKQIVFKEREVRKLKKSIVAANENLMATKLEIKLMQKMSIDMKSEKKYVMLQNNEKKIQQL